MSAEAASAPALSVVVPVFNERDNIPPLVAEIVAALRGVVPFEIVYVDDQSRDDSWAVLQSLMATVPELRALRHRQQSGQSTAIRTGVKAARAPWIATLDGDGQNDLADLPKLLAERDKSPPELKLFAGWRVNRRDSGSKRWASKFANAIRSRMLKDETPDTGCGTKLFERQMFLDLPWFDHMHRYLPALVRRAGYASVSVPVNHRERSSGVSKYNNLQRAWVGLTDLRGVSWLIKRSKVTGVEEAGAAVMNQQIAMLSGFGIHITLWKLIGLTGALMFGGRWLLQFIASKQHGKPVIPRAFWYMSIVGSLMTLSYFLFSAKQDAVGVLQNLFPSFTACYSLYLDIKHRGWHRDKASH